MTEKELLEMTKMIVYSTFGSISDRVFQGVWRSVQTKHALINQKEKNFERRGKTRDDLMDYLKENMFKSPEQQKTDKLEKENKKLKKENESLKQQVNALEKQIEALTKNIK